MWQERRDSALEQRPAPHKSDEREQQHHTDPRFPSCIRVRRDLAHYAYDPSPPCVQVLHLQPSAIMPDGGPGSRTLLQDPELSFRRGHPVPAWVRGQLKHPPQHRIYPPPPPPEPRHWRLHFCQWLFITLETKHSTGSQPYSSLRHPVCWLVTQSPGWWLHAPSGLDAQYSLGCQLKNPVRYPTRLLTTTIPCWTPQILPDM